MPGKGGDLWPRDGTTYRQGRGLHVIREGDDFNQCRKPPLHVARDGSECGQAGSRRGGTIESEAD